MAEKCTQCGHPEKDHGPASGRWRDKITGEWTVIIPGRLCYYEENHGHCEDLCSCSGFNDTKGPLSNFRAALTKAGG